MRDNLFEQRKKNVLELIWKSGQLARAEVARRLNINISAVTYLVDSLLNEGKVIEKGTAPSTGGRKAKLLSISPEWGYVIGLAFSSRGIMVGLANLSGEIVHKNSAVFSLANPCEMTQNILFQAVEEEITRARQTTPERKVHYIGIGISGLVNKGISINFPRYDCWRDIKLKQLFEEKFGIPTVLSNRVSAITLAEQIFGKYKDYRNALYFHLGPGLALGIVINSEVYRGTRTGVGEFGHTRIIDDGPVCYCGSYGCLEVIASDSAMVAYAKQAIQEGASSTIQTYNEAGDIDARAILKAAAEGDRLAYQIVERISGYLGTAIANQVNIFAPEIIILGGTLIEIDDLMLRSIERNLKARCLQRLGEELILAKSSFGPEAGLKGAVTLALSEFFLPNSP